MSIEADVDRAHRPRKRMGQHFLHDPRVIEKILRAIDPRPGDRILEIGPGLGALTRGLLDAAESLDVVEIDRDLVARLQAWPEAVAGALRVHQADALNFDLRTLVKGDGERQLRVVGNLPYNISTPLLFHLLAGGTVVRDMHLMLQREVVERLTAAPGSKRYGRLSVMVQYRCRVTSLFTVGPGAFRPPPSVESSVVRMAPREHPPVLVHDEAVLETLVARAFSQRRKTLRNSLKGLVSAEDLLVAGVDPRARPETLQLAQLAAIANQISRGVHPTGR